MPYLGMLVDLAVTSEIKLIILLFYYPFREYSVRQERKTKLEKYLLSEFIRYYITRVETVHTV